MKYLYIQADTNDADYISELNKISDNDLEKIKPLIGAIKTCKQQHNWDTSEYGDFCPKELYPDFSEGIFETFSNYVPYGEYGIHTIKRIEVYEVTEVTKLL